MLIRMFRDVADFTRLSWMYIRDQGEKPNDILRYFRNGDAPRSTKNVNERDEAHRTYIRLQNQGFNLHYDFTNLIGELGEQLAHADHPQADHNIIDEVISLLNLPYVRNTINAEAIRRLRKAVLIPEEAASLTVKLDRLELHCGGCQALLQEGEMVTLHVGEGRNAERIIYCTRCRVPEYMPCRSCRRTHDIPASLAKMLRKAHKCEPDMLATDPAPPERPDAINIPVAVAAPRIRFNANVAPMPARFGVREQEQRRAIQELERQQLQRNMPGRLAIDWTAIAPANPFMDAPPTQRPDPELAQENREEDPE